jgi:hypothetical protein
VPSYACRRLLVSKESLGRRKDEEGRESYYYRLTVQDTGESDDPALATEPTPYDNVEHHVPHFMAYLDRLGQDGWRVLYFDPEHGYQSSSCGRTKEDWPLGSHFLIRESA